MILAEWFDIFYRGLDKYWGWGGKHRALAGFCVIESVLLLVVAIRLFMAHLENRRKE